VTRFHSGGTWTKPAKQPLKPRERLSPSSEVQPSTPSETFRAVKKVGCRGRLCAKARAVLTGVALRAGGTSCGQSRSYIVRGERNDDLRSVIWSIPSFRCSPELSPATSSPSKYPTTAHPDSDQDRHRRLPAQSRLCRRGRVRLDDEERVHRLTPPPPAAVSFRRKTPTPRRPNLQEVVRRACSSRSS